MEQPTCDAIESITGPCAKPAIFLVKVQASKGHAPWPVLHYCHDCLAQRLQHILLLARVPSLTVTRLDD